MLDNTVDPTFSVSNLPVMTPTASEPNVPVATDTVEVVAPVQDPAVPAAPVKRKRGRPPGTGKKQKAAAAAAALAAQLAQSTPIPSV